MGVMEWGRSSGKPTLHSPAVCQFVSLLLGWTKVGNYCCLCESPIEYASTTVGGFGSVVTDEAWVLIGDFNCVLRGEERSSRRGVSSTFVDWVERRALVDIGFSGPLFT